MNIVDEKAPHGRKLWSMTAETREGQTLIREARRLACRREFSMLTDSELLRIAAGVPRNEPSDRYEY